MLSVGRVNRSLYDKLFTHNIGITLAFVVRCDFGSSCLCIALSHVRTCMRTPSLGSLSRCFIGTLPVVGWRGWPLWFVMSSWKQFVVGSCFDWVASSEMWVIIRAKNMKMAFTVLWLVRVCVIGKLFLRLFARVRTPSPGSLPRCFIGMLSVVVRSSISCER